MKEKKKSLFNLQIDEASGAWFLFARVFMGWECAHLIGDRRPLCFGFFGVCFGLCRLV